MPPQKLWDDPRCEIHCTEKQTGIGLNLHNVFKPDSYEVILKYRREFPNVMDLPLKDGVEEDDEQRMRSQRIWY